jgi:sulfotransferase family protein
MRQMVKRVLAPVGRPAARRLRAGGWIGPDRRPPPWPGDWEIGPPDFVGVGAQRAGTTWWYRLLCDHPRIQRVAGKETHFFDRYFEGEFADEDVAAYHRLFPRPKGSLTGEWSPKYLHDFWTPALLRKAAPDARILVLLRDPMQRLQSGLRHELAIVNRAVRRGRRRYFGAMDANESLARSLYSRQLETLFEEFDRNQVLVLQFERCVQDPAAELRRTYDFLGADPIDHGPPALSERVGGAHPRMQLNAAVTEAAQQLVLHDATKLKAVVPEIDLSLWPSCRDLARAPEPSVAADTPSV